MSLQTSYPFVLPRGYVDAAGHAAQGRPDAAGDRAGRARAAARPDRTGPDDPRLTVLVLARVVEKLGTVELVSSHEIEGLFAADLAFLQDFYGVINFGNQEEYEATAACAGRGAAVAGSEPAGSPPRGGRSAARCRLPNSRRR